MEDGTAIKQYPVRETIKPETAVVLEILGVTPEEFIQKRNNYIHDIGINQDMSYRKLHNKFMVIGISFVSLRNLFRR